MAIKRHRPVTAILQGKMQMRPFIHPRLRQIMGKGGMPRRASPGDTQAPKINILAQKLLQDPLTLTMGQLTRAFGHGEAIARFRRRIGGCKKIAAGAGFAVKPDKPEHPGQKAHDWQPDQPVHYMHHRCPPFFVNSTLRGSD